MPLPSGNNVITDADILSALLSSHHDALPTSIERIDARTLSPSEFSRRFVCASLPVILTHATDDWKAHTLWQNEAGFLSGDTGDSSVTLAVTPDGRADSSDIDIADGALRLPLEISVSLRDAVKILRDPKKCGISYLSAQNDVLRRDLPILAAAARSGVGDNGDGNDGSSVGVLESFASVLGPIEAVNIWASGIRETTSQWHRDHYDNFHTIITGEKIFKLLPPSGVLILQKRLVTTRRWSHEHFLPHTASTAVADSGSKLCDYTNGLCNGGGGGGVDANVSQCPCWNLKEAPDALPPGSAKIPWVIANQKNVIDSNPFIIALLTGETLFLPALWYHEVISCANPKWLTITVNTWYEAQAQGANVASASFFEHIALKNSASGTT
jgi:jumonji domain-containing protein 7